TGPQSIHILRGVRQQQDEPGRFSICSRQAAVVLPCESLKTYWLIGVEEGSKIEAVSFTVGSG
ncbi:hypothetical protein, partial [Salmonella enterica]|uniref:hypothetical protein n=1 Tax=Salmonella enterica TaxID=28901 RepID=UPI000AB89465